MKRIALWAGLLVMFAACAPVATGSSSFQPFDLTQPQTVKAGGLYYFAKTYDQTNWIRKTILTNDGRVFSESVQAVGPTLPLTWSDSPDQIREELATQLQSPRCSTIGDGASAWLTWFYISQAQIPAGWQLETFSTNGVLRCDAGLRKEQQFGRTGYIVQTMPFSTFYRFNFKLTVPANAQAGNYPLSWTVFDRHTGKSVVETATVTVVNSN